jgi:hypothetical protein
MPYLCSFGRSEVDMAVPTAIPERVFLPSVAPSASLGG